MIALIKKLVAIAFFARLDHHQMTTTGFPVHRRTGGRLCVGFVQPQFGVGDFYVFGFAISLRHFFYDIQFFCGEIRESALGLLRSWVVV